MNLKVLFFVVLSCFVGLSYQELCSKICGRNEEYSVCGGGVGECQKTCLTSNRTEDLGCACVAGCICKEGYVINPIDYKCIRISKCPPIAKCSCGKNEMWSESLAGCQRDCDSQDVMFKCAPLAGCICRDGFFRSPINNQCISKAACELCPKNYIRSFRGNQCTLNCEQCTIGSVDECPINESCQCRLTDCERNCENRRYPCDPINPNCVTKCFCSEGYIRINAGGLCVPVEQCGPIFEF